MPLWVIFEKTVVFFLPIVYTMNNKPNMEEESTMKVARFVLKIVALSLTAAGAICAIIAYWDKLAELGDLAKTKVQQKACAAEYEDYEE